MKSERWNSAPIRRFGTLVGGGTPTAGAANWDGDVPFATPPDLRPKVGRVVGSTERTVTVEGAESGSSLVPAGVVLLSIRAPIGYVARTGCRMAFNQGCRAIVPLDSVSAGYLTYALIAAGEELQSLGRGTTFMELSATQLAALELPVPPLDEQRAIADYLDRETARIDTLIEEQQRLIDLLRERRRDLIRDAVLGSVNPLSPPPEVFTTVGHHFSVTLGKMLDAGKVPREGDQTLPYIRAANIQDAGLQLDSVNEMPYSEAEVASLNLLEGDLLVVEGGAVGTSVVVEEDMPGWSFQKTVNRVRPLDASSSAWLGYLLRTYRDIGVIDIVCNKSTIQHFTAEKVRALRIPLVVPDEQRRIAAYLDDQTSKIDQLIVATDRFIELSRERRAALITAAVTGQIDVREVA